MEWEVSNVLFALNGHDDFDVLAEIVSLKSIG